MFILLFYVYSLLVGTIWSIRVTLLLWLDQLQVWIRFFFRTVFDELDFSRLVWVTEQSSEFKLAQNLLSCAQYDFFFFFVCDSQQARRRQPHQTFWGAFAKLRKATVSFAAYICLSVRMEQLGSHWTDFYEIWYFSVFRKSVENIQV